MRWDVKWMGAGFHDACWRMRSRRPSLGGVKERFPSSIVLVSSSTENASHVVTKHVGAVLSQDASRDVLHVGAQRGGPLWSWDVVSAAPR